FAAARALAADAAAESDARANAIMLLGRDPRQRAEDLAVLEQLLDPKLDPALTRGALVGLARTKDPRSAAILLAGCAQLLPDARAQVQDILLGRREWTQELLAALERDELAPGALDAAHRARLLEHQDPALRERAAKLLGAPRPDDRAKALADYQSALAL